MGELAKVFLAASIGTVLGAYAEPLIVPRLPQSMQTPLVGKIVHASIAGGSTVAIFAVIRGATK